MFCVTDAASQQIKAAKESLQKVCNLPQEQLTGLIIKRPNIVPRLVNYGGAVSKARVLKTLCLSAKDDGEIAFKLVQDEDVYGVVQEMASVKREKKRKSDDEAREEAEEIAQTQANFNRKMAELLDKIKAGPVRSVDVANFIRGDKNSVAGAIISQLTRIESKECQAYAGALAE
jgi:hypothetical protein